MQVSINLASRGRAFLDIHHPPAPATSQLRGVLLILLLGGALVCLSPFLGGICNQDGVLVCGP